jgi:phenylacetate-CoA ligase
VTALLTPRETVIYGGLAPVFKRNLLRDAREIRARARWSVDEMEAYRLRRFRGVLQHAQSTVPYYRDLFARLGFDASAFRSFDELQSIPPLTRELLREHFAALKSTAVPEDAVTRRSTGGTSGKPVTVLLDRDGEAERMLVNHRMYAMMGRPLGAPTLMIAGSPIDAVAWTSLRDRVKNRLFGIDVSSSFNLTPDALNAIAIALKSGAHRWIIAYSSVFDILAAYAEQTGQRLHLANIIPCAELVSGAQRERWRDAFGAEVFEIYGSREMTSIAGETGDHDGLVVSGDVYHVEITDEAGRILPHGTPGLITISTLGERGMPLLRYQLGDVGVLAPPPQGSPWPFPRLRITHGRVLDVICCPNGKMLPGEFFPHLMKEVEDRIERFQVVQPAIDRLDIRIVPKPQWAEATADYLRHHIRAQVGDEVTIAFELVDAIETAASGKYRPTICLLPESQKRFGAR